MNQDEKSIRLSSDKETTFFSRWQEDRKTVSPCLLMQDVTTELSNNRATFPHNSLSWANHELEAFSPTRSVTDLKQDSSTKKKRVSGADVGSTHIPKFAIPP